MPTDLPQEPRLLKTWLGASTWRIARLGLIQSFVAVVVGIGICLLIILVVADDPLTAFRSFVLGTFSTTYAFGSMIAVATVLVLTALAATVSFRAGHRAEEAKIDVARALSRGVALAVRWAVR
jgi:hypothetical protein